MKRRVWSFIIQVISLLWIPVLIVDSCITQGMLEFSAFWGNYDGFSTIMMELSFFIMLPIGIIGFATSSKKKDNIRFRTATRVLSIINICLGIIMIALIMFEL